LKKILIAEDDPDTMDLTEILLRQAGYAVIKINQPILLKEVSGIKPDLVILDYLMPHPLGSDICRELKNDPLTKGIPVILFLPATTWWTLPPPAVPMTSSPSPSTSTSFPAWLPDGPNRTFKIYLETKCPLPIFIAHGTSTAHYF
jgi:hypothetical protein